MDGAAAWSFSENNSFQIHADYLYHRFDVFKTDPAAGKMPFYYGIGARAKLKDENDGKGQNDKDELIGIRFPVGLSYLFTKTPLEIFGEFVPVLDVSPDTEFRLYAAYGARYYFH